MSSPKPPDPVKLISNIFSRSPQAISEAIEVMCKEFGPTDWISPQIPFDRTRYYEKEMGWPLYRRFISFENLIDPGALPEIKHKAIGVEIQFSQGTKRLINIDPGYVALERLILATGKNYMHRVYLRDGIYADLTLVYVKGGFSPLKWTYPDYREEEVIRWFNRVRDRYKDQLRGRL